jgi:hypothetical protein
METDAEASGELSPAAVEPVWRGKPEHTNATSHASAMRSPEDRAERTGARSRRWEMWALLGALAVALIFLIAFLFVDDGRPTAPVDRVDEQNTGADAPCETLPSPDGDGPSRTGE